MDLAPTLLLDLALSCDGLDPAPAAAEPDSPDQAEARLVADLKAGLPEAFETLVRRHADQMHAVARRYLPSDADADDAVQEALLKAFTCIHQFKEEARLSTWLHRIVVNAALMNRRSRSRKREVFLGDHDHADLVPATPTAPTAAAPDPETRRTAARQATAVLQHIARLPECHRGVLELRCVQHVPTAEAARSLGVTPAALKTKLHRAKRRLHESLGLEGGFWTDSDN